MLVTANGKFHVTISYVDDLINACIDFDLHHQSYPYLDAWHNDANG